MTRIVTRIDDSNSGCYIRREVRRYAVWRGEARLVPVDVDVDYIWISL